VGRHRIELVVLRGERAIELDNIHVVGAARDEPQLVGRQRGAQGR
jgi:hypothetical protein